MATDVVMPRLSDSMEEATVIRWLVAEGDPVRRGEPIVEIETDKATVVHEAEVDGVLLQIVSGEGATVALGETIAVIGRPGEAAKSRPADLPAAPADAGPPASTARGNGAASAPAPAADPAPERVGGRVAASPLARRVARTLGVDLAAVAGTGPAGRVVRADVEAAAVDTEPAGRAPRERAPADAEPVETARGEVRVVALTRVQQTVARRMAESRATVPDFELRAEVDMGACVEMRDQLRALRADPLPSYNDMIVKAAAMALRGFPRVNGAYRDGSVECYGRVNVGVAVAAEDALVVPVVADADRSSLGVIARRTRELAIRVRDGSITPAELAGATFTVSNLGMFDVDSFTAIINAPQAAILAVGALRRRPVVTPDGEIVARPLVTVTLACDHRVVYGADGARFLARVRELLEHPAALAL